MTYLAAAAGNVPEHLIHMSLGDAGIVALLGYAVVFFGLVLLLIVVSILGKCFTAAANRKKAPVVTPTEAPVPVAEPQAPAVAPGTAGQLKLHDVSPKTAAMLMAIVADKMGKPLNELRFISIKEVK